MNNEKEQQNNIDINNYTPSNKNVENYSVKSKMRSNSYSNIKDRLTKAIY